MNENEIEKFATGIFSHLQSFTNYYTNGNFSLYTLIEEYLDYNLATDGSDFQKEKDEEYERIKFPVKMYLIRHGYFQEIEPDDEIIQLTEKGREAKRLGSIEKYEQKVKDDEELSELSKNSLQATIEANEISKETNEISKKAKEISIYSVVIAVIAIIVSFFSPDDVSKSDIENLRKEINTFKERQSKIEAYYIKNIDSLKNEINKLKKK